MNTNDMNTKYVRNEKRCLACQQCRVIVDDTGEFYPVCNDKLCDNVVQMDELYVSRPTPKRENEPMKDKNGGGLIDEWKEYLAKRTPVEVMAELAVVLAGGFFVAACIVIIFSLL